MPAAATAAAAATTRQQLLHSWQWLLHVAQPVEVQVGISAVTLHGDDLQIPAKVTRIQARHRKAVAVAGEHCGAVCVVLQKYSHETSTSMTARNTTDHVTCSSKRQPETGHQHVHSHTHTAQTMHRSSTARSDIASDTQFLPRSAPAARLLCTAVYARMPTRMKQLCTWLMRTLNLHEEMGSAGWQQHLQSKTGAASACRVHPDAQRFT
eukprot:GHRQ01038569.1.p1 GENE.GHRQ01038569.1~~GHRQ01038569.1.p1  ORF type:complete len:209 (-),score=25.54 GHRQ01038569.1:84-710(-)